MHTFGLMLAVIFATMLAAANAFDPITLGSLIALKFVALKAGIVGGYLGSRSRFGGRRRFRGRRRFGRSAEESDMDRMILEASLEDSEDCAKKLVCLVNASPMETLDADEKVLYNLFGNADGSIRVTSDSAEFDLAAYMGRKAGGQQCQKIYARCPYNKKDMMSIFKTPNEIV